MILTCGSLVFEVQYLEITFSLTSKYGSSSSNNFYIIIKLISNDRTNFDFNHFIVLQRSNGQIFTKFKNLQLDY